MFINRIFIKIIAVLLAVLIPYGAYAQISSRNARKKQEPVSSTAGPAPRQAATEGEPPVVTSYTVNSRSAVLPAYMRINDQSRTFTLNIAKDGQRTVRTTFVDTVEGWTAEGHLVCLDNRPIGIAYDFSQGIAYLMPVELTERLIEGMRSSNRLALDGITAREAGTGRTQIVLADAVALRNERPERFFALTQTTPVALDSSVLSAYRADSSQSMTIPSTAPEATVIWSRPLITAAANGQTDQMLGLLRAGTNINETDPESGDNALTRALVSSDERIADILIREGINLNHSNRYGQNALHLASGAGYYNTVQKLLVAGLDVNRKDALGNTPLMYGAQSPNPSVVSLLLQRGARINETNGNGNTALSFAAYNGNTRSVEILLGNGADPNIRDSQGNSILMSAIKGGNEYIVDTLVSGRRVAVNERDSEGNSPLHVAVLSQSEAVASLLIDYGADVNTVNNQGQTPLMLAVASGNEGIAAKIVAKEPDLFIVDHQGRTASDYVPAQTAGINRVMVQAHSEADRLNRELYDLVAANNLAAVRQRVDSGAPLNTPDRTTGNTPLFTAVANNYRDIAEILIDNGANVNWVNLRGNTPLIMAVSNGDLRMIQILLQAGAQPNAQNTFGDTALIWAIKLQRADVVRALLLAGANPNVRNYEGYGPLDVARGENMLEIENILTSFGAF